MFWTRHAPRLGKSTSASFVKLLGVEELEGRFVLASDLEWSPTDGYFFEVAANWIAPAGDVQHVPVNGDNIIFHQADHVVVRLGQIVDLMTVTGGDAPPLTVFFSDQFAAAESTAAIQAKELVLDRAVCHPNCLPLKLNELVE